MSEARVIESKYSLAMRLNSRHIGSVRHSAARGQGGV